MPKMQMKAPKGTKSAFIEGHEYDVPKNGIIDVVSATHVETLQRHGFKNYEPETTHDDVDAMSKDELVEFIESHGGDTEDMNKKELKAAAHELVDSKGEE